MKWEREPEFIGANRARAGDYELVVFDLPADRAGPAVIGWELFGPPRHQELIDHGDALTFDDAKAAAEPRRQPRDRRRHEGCGPDRGCTELFPQGKASDEIRSL